MMAGLAADLLLVVHLAFIGFAVFGGLLVAQRPKLAWLHIPCLLWAVSIACGGWICPLTPLEQHLRLAAGETGYRGGFVDHYIAPLIYPAGLTRTMQIIFGLFVLALNTVVYGWVARRRGRKKRG